MLFNILKNYLCARLKGIPKKLVDNNKLGGAVDSLQGREALQRDVDKLEVWTITSHMKYNKGKYHILHLSWGNSGCTDSQGNEILEISAMERDLVSW